MSEEIRKLDKNEVVQRGDLVTIDEDESSGFREYDGALIGLTAGDYFYPIYRKESLKE